MSNEWESRRKEKDSSFAKVQHKNLHYLKNTWDTISMMNYNDIGNIWNSKGKYNNEDNSEIN